MDDADAYFAIFLNVIMPLVFYVASQWAMFTVTREKTVRYRFMITDLLVIESIICITTSREMLYRPEIFPAWLLLSVFVTLLVYPSITSILEKMSAETERLLIQGYLFTTMAFGTILYKLAFWFVIAGIFFALSCVTAIFHFDLTKMLSKLRKLRNRNRPP